MILKMWMKQLGIRKHLKIVDNYINKIVDSQYAVINIY